LVLAARLSANESLTVAVIEAGLDGSAVETDILAPAQVSRRCEVVAPLSSLTFLNRAQAYFDGIASMTSDYDYHYNTETQSGLDNRAIYWPRCEAGDRQEGGLRAELMLAPCFARLGLAEEKCSADPAQ
jgi:choline dehydrogenase